MAPSQFTVCVLCYGDYPDLAWRCLESIVNSLPDDGGPVGAMHIGLNAVGKKTKRAVAGLAASAARKLRSRVWLWDSPVNRMKYPLMRRMLGHTAGSEAPYLMWFDDDSWITKPCAEWWQAVGLAMSGADMIGDRFTIKPRGNQLKAVAAQPWYTGREFPAGYQFSFVTGGWWTAKRRVLARLGYPWPELRHNGGDVMLGEAIRQQNLSLRQFSVSLAINADKRGRNSKAERRGVVEEPLWSKWKPDAVVDLAHHDFTIEPRQIVTPQLAAIKA